MRLLPAHKQTYPHIKWYKGSVVDPNAPGDGTI